ncbi:unnamed protein product [Cylicocyclus nassatus]|uniref:STPR domain-containing protein n=1 Tax=Cylicocyclus nassatus TaxID=53992 RepID=A0AA36DSQ2_CYLNA|nr:unnamed protein product [Cylicocyclus nassatus]
MPPKRSYIGSVDPRAKRMRETREAETPDQRARRLENERVRMSEARASETTEEYEARLEENRRRNAELRAAETPEQRRARLEDIRLRVAELTAAETPEQHQERLEQNRIRIANIRASETPEDRQGKNEENRQRVAASRATETPEQRQTRLDVNSSRQRQRFKLKCKKNKEMCNNIEERKRTFLNIFLFRADKMAKNMENTSYRKIEVDAYDPENYDENEDAGETLGLGPNERTVTSFLQANRFENALHAALLNPPL